MMMIKPANIVPATLVASNVPTNDAAAWAPARTDYAKGEQVIDGTHLWEWLSDTKGNTAVKPSADTSVPSKWLDTGPINQWRMFDKSAGQLATSSGAQVQRQIFQIGTKTVNPGSIDITLQPGTVVDSVALFGLSGYRVTITMQDSVDGVVYGPEEVSLVDPAASNMWEWLFTKSRRRSRIVLTNLPAYGTASIRILIEAGPGENAECAMVVVGALEELGVALFGGGFGITDFSTKDADAFGNETFIERGYRNRVTYPVAIYDEMVSSIRDLLIEYRTKPAVFIGDIDREWSLIYGRYKDLSVTVPQPSFSECTLEVGELI